LQDYLKQGRDGKSKDPEEEEEEPTNHFNDNISYLELVLGATTTQKTHMLRLERFPFHLYGMR
jgi:hypothetical protein